MRSTLPVRARYFQGCLLGRKNSVRRIHSGGWERNSNIRTSYLTGGRIRHEFVKEL
jgi:hypothetical protein